MKRKHIIHASIKQIVLYGLLAVGLLTLLVWIRIRVETISMETQKLQAEKVQLENTVAYLRAEFLQKTQYSNIESIVSTQLHLKFPEQAPVTLIVPAPPKRPWTYKWKHRYRTLLQRYFND